LNKYLFFKLGGVVDFGFSPCFVPQSPVEPESRAITSPITLRTAETQDIKLLVDLLTLSFHPPHGLLAPFYPLLKLGIYEDLRSRLRSQSSHYRCIVASAFVAGGQSEILLGTAEVALRSSLIGMPRSPYISNFAVSPPYRRQGIGRKLLQRCELIAQNWNCPDLALHVLEDNQAAKELYFSSGYELHRIEPSWRHWIFQSPRRLYLQKSLRQFQVRGNPLPL
jgi:ribosomal protein S18 acetylase RimI-like enzyme